MRVRAKRRGFYGNVLRREGDVFELTLAEGFSSRWMERVADDTPECRTSAQAAIDRESEARSALGRTRRDVYRRVDPLEDRPVDFDFDPFKS